jgi:hypothetical protein
VQGLIAAVGKSRGAPAFVMNVGAPLGPARTAGRVSSGRA